MKKNITLTILHNIFLTREERYKLVEGKEIEVVGVSVPVWFCKGKTTEPGEELFVKYRLSNDNNLRAIVNWEEGYAINIPQHSAASARLIKAINEETAVPNANSLKDFTDGGSEWLYFKQYTKLIKGNRTYDILHFVELKDISALEESVYQPSESAIL